MEIYKCVGISLLFFYFIATVSSLPYDVHWLGGATTIERDVPLASKQSVDIYCYPGAPKSILALWQTVKFHIRIKKDEFSQYLGSAPDEVYKAYTEDSYGWSVNPFQKKTQKVVSLDLFSPTCMAINTKLKHTIEVQVIRVDIWRVLLMVAGCALVLWAHTLSGNPLFFYLCGVLIGVCASFLVLVYYISKLLPAKKYLTYGVLIGGWTVGVYVFQQIWENARSLAASYQSHMFWYTVVAGFISFLVCYRIGPPRNRRSKNLVMWVLQAVGVCLMLFSSGHREAAGALSCVVLFARYLPAEWIYKIRGYWLRRFPPAPRLLTNEQYYEQGARETKRALDELRKHCASPDCAQWRVVMSLNDSKRFASFVEGNSHLSDDEVLDYESYAFSLERKRKPPSMVNSTTNQLEISDDDSSDEDEL